MLTLCELRGGDRARRGTLPDSHATRHCLRAPLRMVAVYWIVLALSPRSAIRGVAHRNCSRKGKLPSTSRSRPGNGTERTQGQAGIERAGARAGPVLRLPMLYCPSRSLPPILLPLPRAAIALVRLSRAHCGGLSAIISTPSWPATRAGSSPLTDPCAQRSRRLSSPSANAETRISA